MTICITCGDYFRFNAYHSNKLECQNCAYQIFSSILDSDDEAEISTLLNPSSKTLAVFYDDRDDSHGF
jgi:hypothetical protein